MTKKIIKILARIKDLPVSQINLEKKIAEDLQFTSLDFAILLTQIETKFNIEIDIQTFLSLTTVNDLIDHVESIIK